MAVKIGTVSTFADVKPDKAQAVKILEESAEVFAEWQNWNDCSPFAIDFGGERLFTNTLIDECADVIQATCNLLAALGVDDLTAVLDRCKQKNIERGREYE